MAASNMTDSPRSRPVSFHEIFQGNQAAHYRYIDLLTQQLRTFSTPEQSAVAWIEAGADGVEILGELRAFITRVRDAKRRLSPPRKDPRIEALNAALKTLDRSRREYNAAVKGSAVLHIRRLQRLRLRCQGPSCDVPNTPFPPPQPYKNPVAITPWSSDQERAARHILGSALANLEGDLPALEPDKLADAKRTAALSTQFVRALWALHEELDQFVPANFVDCRAMEVALDEIFSEQTGHSVGLEIYLAYFEQNMPADARDIVSQSFNRHEGSLFDLRQYRWFDHEEGNFSGDMPGDLIKITQALRQLSPMGQSFVRVAAMEWTLLREPRRWDLHTFVAGGDRKYKHVTRPIICELEWPPVSVRSWPFA